MVLNFTSAIAANYRHISQLKIMYPYWGEIMEANSHLLPRRYAECLYVGGGIGIVSSTPWPLEKGSNLMMEGMYFKYASKEDLRRYAFDTVDIRLGKPSTQYPSRNINCSHFG